MGGAEGVLRRLRHDADAGSHGGEPAQKQRHGPRGACAPSCVQRCGLALLWRRGPERRARDAGSRQAGTPGLVCQLRLPELHAFSPPVRPKRRWTGARRHSTVRPGSATARAPRSGSHPLPLAWGWWGGANLPQGAWGRSERLACGPQVWRCGVQRRARRSFAPPARPPPRPALWPPCSVVVVLLHQHTPSPLSRPRARTGLPPSRPRMVHRPCAVLLARHVATLKRHCACGCSSVG